VIDGLKPYPAMKVSGVLWLGEVPEHWGVLPNRVIFDEIKERDRPEADMLSVTITKGVIRQQTLLEDSSKKDGSKLDRSAYKFVRPGDIAYNKMRAWQGAVGVSEFEGIISPAYVVERPREGADPHYLHHLLRTPAFAKEAERWSYGITSDMWSLRPEHFKMIYSCLPPLPEQAAIVRFLNHADRNIRRYIRAKQKLIKLLEEQKQAIIHRAVTHGLDPNVPLKDSGISWLGEIPGHWEIWRISRFATVGNGSTPSRGESKYWSSSDYPWLNSSQINRGLIDSADQFVSMLALNECHLPKVTPGSVLVAITGQGRTRGKSAILAIEATINQHIAYLSLRLQIASPEFLNLVLTAAYTHLRSISDDSGSTKGALTCEDLKRLKIPVPPHEEQRVLLASTHSATTETINTISRLESEIVLLREYRTRLIADVVTGKLDVREAAAQLPDDEQDTHRLDELDEISDPEEDPLDDLLESPEEPEQ